MGVNDEQLKAAVQEASDAGPDDDLPSGSHALEVAARRGFGPLSTAARQIWHGNAAPCVTCGQLVMRGSLQCDHCGQDLRADMLDKMKAHAGPWFVLEHLRPFPGVSLDRIIRQIRRGLITETSIVRGPATDFRWCFAVETPGLCRYFGKCWHCHHGVTASDVYCPACLSHLSFEEARPAILATPPSTTPTPGSTTPQRANGTPPLVGGAAGSTAHVAPARANIASPVVSNAPSTLRAPAVPARVSPSPLSAVRAPIVAAVADAAPLVVGNIPSPRPTPPAPTMGSAELVDLASAVRSLGTPPTPRDFEAASDSSPSRTGWIIAVAAVVTLGALLGIVQLRSKALAPTEPAAVQFAP